MVLGFVHFVLFPVPLRNLTRHMRQIHKNHSLGENVEGNSEKFIFLGCDNSDEEQAELKNDQETNVVGCQFADDNSVTLENLQRISFNRENSAEHFFPRTRAMDA